jgi:hypothetical protein
MLVAPLVAALDGYDFDGRLYSGLLPTIESSPWLRGQDLELTHLGLDHDIEQKLDESNTRQMLLLRGTYYVDFHDQRLIVELQATLLPGSNATTFPTNRFFEIFSISRTLTA